uniref:Uncharacterized protein n=1 Tax=Eubacterium plexicaudatum ASF492 TaxID=1235802 RepID=N2B5W3_9FIRM
MDIWKVVQAEKKKPYHLRLFIREQYYGKENNL